MTLRNVLLSTGLCFSLAFCAMAQESKEGKSGCSKGAACCKNKAKVASAEAGKEGCDPAACNKNAVAKMPKMMYKVGDEKACCPKQAEELAKGDKSKIRYIVGDKSFEKESEAMEAYAAVLEKHLSEITSVQYAVGDKTMACPMSAASTAKAEGKPVEYRVATFTFKDEKAAQNAAKLAKDAADKIEMKVMVDGKEVKTCSASKSESASGCSHAKGEAKAEAKSEGCSKDKAAVAKGDEAKAAPVKAEGEKTEAGKREFCIGETKTCCETVARVELVKARIQRAFDAISKVAGA